MSQSSSSMPIPEEGNVCRIRRYSGYENYQGKENQPMNSHWRVREEFARQAESLSVAPVFTDAEVLEKIRAATSPTKTTQILDLGCGPGIISAWEGGTPLNNSIDGQKPL